MRKAVKKMFALFLIMCVIAFASACVERSKESAKDNNSTAGENPQEQPSIEDWGGFDNELPIVPID